MATYRGINADQMVSVDVFINSFNFSMLKNTNIPFIAVMLRSAKLVHEHERKS